MIAILAITPRRRPKVNQKLISRPQVLPIS